MSKTHTSISCLEQLPDELWLLILTHLSPADRLYTFSNLNFRLNAILREAGAGVNDAMACDSGLFHEWSPCVSYVKLQHRSDVIDLYSLKHIRSLTILHIMRYQIPALDPIYMPNLRHLHVTSPSNTLDACYGRLLELILNGNFQSLVSIDLPQADFFGIYDCAGHSGLQRVIVGACRSNRFANLVGLMPNVLFLEIRHLISWPIRQTVTHSNIRCLKFHVETHSVEAQDIEALRIASPSLEHVQTVELKTKLSKCLPITSYDTTRDDDDF